MVPKADGIKQLRGLRSSGLKSGDWPIRLKGYYRALKRGEGWAVKLSKETSLNFWLKWTYSRVIEQILFVESPFLKLLGRNDWNTKPIPVVYGKKDE